MLCRKLSGFLVVVFVLFLIVFFLSCASSAEREQRRQWELEGRNPRTGLFDEPFSGKSFQEKEELEEYLETDEFQRAYENHQRFLAIRSEHQIEIDERNRQINEQNRLIDAENEQIDRKNREIDQEITAFRNRVNREYSNWRDNANRRYPRPSDASYSSSFELNPINRYGLANDGFRATGRITIDNRVVFNETRTWLPERPFPTKENRKPRINRIVNSMTYNPDVTY